MQTTTFPSDQPQAASSNHQLNQAETRKLVGAIQIPPQPEVVRALIAERASDEPDLQRIVHLISSDVGLSAAVLKAINSPYYGLHGKIGSIQHAVSMLGLKNIGSLVMGLALRNSTRVEGIERFWESASRSAELAGLLAKRLSLPLVEEAHLYTLFHNSAVPLLLQRFPDYGQTMKELARNDFIEATVLEDARHNTNHAVVGGLLASNWGLPDDLHEAISRHHDITVFSDAKLSERVVTLIALGHVAEHVESSLTQQMNDSAWCEFGELSRRHLLLGEDEMREFTDAAKDLFGIAEY
jgi:HD-like signal output (HDOD) protein